MQRIRRDDAPVDQLRGQKLRDDGEFILLLCADLLFEDQPGRVSYRVN
ncbi:MAG: hypothetical protein ACJ797_25805 [Ktedonobacteraceae bacterium]